MGRTIPAPPLPSPEWYFPHTIRGWLSEEEGRLLAALAAGKTVLEIGSFCGRSTACMAQTASVVYALDWHRGDKDAGRGWTLPEFVGNLCGRGLMDRVVPLVGRVEQVASVLADGWADFVFIDGAHDFESASRDARLAERCLVPGGVLAMHDYCRDCAVKHVVEVLVADGWRLAERAGTVAVLRRD